MPGIDIEIAKAEDVDLTGGDIRRITDGKARILVYNDLRHFKSIDELLGPDGAVVILYQTRENFGHWVALFWTDRANRKLEFFDSYGLAVDEELEIAPEFNMRQHGGELVAHLTALVELCSDCKVTSNKAQLQKVLEHTNTCGRWTALRIRFRDTPLKDFVRMMTHNKHYDGDWFASALTLLV